MKVIEKLLKQPYWIITLIVGAVFVVLPCVTKTKEGDWTTHAPNSYLLVWVGVALLLLSTLTFGYVLLSNKLINGADAGAGLNLVGVHESNGRIWTTVNRCEIEVVNGRIEDRPRDVNTAIALPCSEYFDNCVEHSTTALGAFTTKVFEGQLTAFQSLIEAECQKKLSGTKYERASGHLATSYGVGKCLLFRKPLERGVSIALVSTGTQRAGEGISSRISYLFDGIRELAAKLADARISDVVMPIFGGGHGGLSPPLALVGTLLAVAETARYGERGHRLKRITIVVFKRDANSAPEVEGVVVRRALALISSLE